MTAGALAGGAAIAWATVSGSHPAPLPPQSRAPQDDRAGAPPTGPAPAIPAPRPAEATPRVSDVSAPAPARTTSVRWRAHDPQAFRPTRAGTTAPHVRHGEVTCHVGSGRRCELEPALPALDEGDEHVVAVSVRLDHPATGGHHVVVRWDNDGPGAAPVDLRVRDGRLVLHGGDGHPSGTRTASRDLGPAPVGEWTRLAVRVRFSANPEKGSVSVRRDGRTVVDRHRPPGGTLYPGQQSHLSAGVRRESAAARPPTVRLRDWYVAGVRTSEGPSTGDRTEAHRSTSHQKNSSHQSTSSRQSTSSHRSTGRHARTTATDHGSGHRGD
ncbi:heparin lyase I family protein [Actinomycetospora sp. TBRC 11914]|uniref:heparin lyase I family protein n=1 Tax=Actinomycetospora sp. TBRC 11914 TaxID=2729387 RepID=UPI00145EE18A|nr:heparin lyase I family protein [Actinomycetospora sp. TBRC 11914]NMO88390.1 hypothetical protein [Actinomycetospora sp. TBRC 11914]